MTAIRASTEPMDPQSAIMIEKAHGLPEGSLDPMRGVPLHDAIADPDEPGVTYVLERYVDDGRRVPCGPIVAGILRALDRGVDLGRMIRAAGVDPGIVRECMDGERRSAPHAVMERMAIALEDDAIRTMADSTEECPYLLMSEIDGGCRVVINARMDGGRADRIVELVAARTAAVVTPSTGPSPRPVAVRMDAVLPRDEADEVVRTLMDRKPAKRRL